VLPFFFSLFFNGFQHGDRRRTPFLFFLPSFFLWRSCERVRFRLYLPLFLLAFFPDSQSSRTLFSPFPSYRDQTEEPGESFSPLLFFLSRPSFGAPGRFPFPPPSDTKGEVVRSPLPFFFFPPFLPRVIPTDFFLPFFLPLLLWRYVRG